MREVDEIDEGDTLKVDMSSGEIVNLTKDKRYKFTPIPDFMQQLIDAGGLIEFAKKEMAENG